MTASKVQCDEIWSFCYAKQKNVSRAIATLEESGDVWTWTALDADSKLIISYLVGGRDGGYAFDFIADVKDRLANRVQLTTDGYRAYLEAVETALLHPADERFQQEAGKPHSHAVAVLRPLQLLPHP